VYIITVVSIIAMAPSFSKLAVAALMCAGNVVAKQWYLDETYDATNFFDKFNFFEVSETDAEINGQSLSCFFVFFFPFNREGRVSYIRKSPTDLLYRVDMTPASLRISIPHTALLDTELRPMLLIWVSSLIRARRSLWG
jgi:hypothetical protein